MGELMLWQRVKHQKAFIFEKVSCAENKHGALSYRPTMTVHVVELF